MTEKHYSLRIHLLRLISIPIILAGLVIGGLALAFTYQEIDEVYDAQLAQSAKLLLQLTQDQLEDKRKHGVTLGMEKPDFSHLYEKKISFRIWAKETLVTESASAGIFGDKPASLGFSTHNIGDNSWRFFVTPDDDSDLLIEVAENKDIRTELIQQILSSLFIPALIFLPVILGFVWLGTSRSLKPVISLSQQVNRRGAQDLTPLGTNDISREILPFIDALNRMLLRLDRTLQHEREFTDNAAHELRTPLAAMKTQTQVLLKKAAHMPECKEELGNLLASIDRASRLVDQLLVFARLQNMNDAMEQVDLSAQVEDILRDMFHMLDERQQRLDVHVEQGLKLRGSPSALGILIRNLVDNASKYSPPNGHIAVRAGRKNGNIILTVSDEGPGIPEVLHEKVFDRFYRINKGQGTGSGLGLAMVKWIADMHQAGISMENTAPHGLVIKVDFAAA